MATDAGRKTPRRDSVVGSINSLDGTAEVVRGFCNALRTFNSEQGFQSLAELVDRVPKLEADVQEREKALKSALETSEREKMVQQTQLKNNLQMYTEEHDRLKKDKKSAEQQIAALQTSMASKDKVMAEQEGKEAGLKELARRSEVRCKELKTDLDKRDDNIAQLTERNQSNCIKARDLAADLKRSRGETTAAKGLLQEMQQRTVQLEKSLRVVQNQQQELAGYSAQLKDMDATQLAQKFDAIWVSIIALVRKFVGDDLSDTMLKRDWEVLNESAKYVMDKPLPQNNSQIAKELRVVKVLFIIADSMDKHLLQPTYHLPDEISPLKRVFNHLATVDPKRERVMRGMFLAALESEHEGAGENLPSRIINDVVRKHGVGDVILSEFYNEFERSLNVILCHLQDIWREVQYSTRLFEASFEGSQTMDFGWHIAEPQQSESSRNQTYDDDDDAVMLFPIIFLVGGETIPITTGMIVRKSRINALMKEERHNSRSAEPGPSRPRQRPRTMSISSSARNGTTKEAFLPRPVGAANGPSKA